MTTATPEHVGKRVTLTVTRPEPFTATGMLRKLDMQVGMKVSHWAVTDFGTTHTTLTIGPATIELNAAHEYTIELLEENPSSDTTTVNTLRGRIENTRKCTHGWLPGQCPLIICQHSPHVVTVGLVCPHGMSAGNCTENTTCPHAQTAI